MYTRVNAVEAPASLPIDTVNEHTRYIDSSAVGETAAISESLRIRSMLTTIYMVDMKSQAEIEKLRNVIADVCAEGHVM